MKLPTTTRGALLLPAMILATACMDLALEPPDDVSYDEYFHSLDDFRAAMIGIYDQMQLPDWYGRNLPLVADIMGDDVKPNGSTSRYGFRAISDFQGYAVSGPGVETELWAELYEAINMANMLLNADFVPPAGVQAEFRQLVGEARAARALAYFDLVRTYAQHYTFTADASHPGVPIVLESDLRSLPARSTVAEVYAQIIADLDAAVDLMTMTRAGPYMLTREAAQALLSRVYLYMEDFGGAVAMAGAVVGSGKYSLATGAAYVDQFAAGGSSEAVFEIRNTESDNWGSSCLGCMYVAHGYGDFLPTSDLLDLIHPDDIRMQWFVEDPLLVGIYASMRVNKYPSPTRDDNVPVIRLSEVYLNRAEAYARSGQEDEARADLDRIRRRALATAPAVTATGQALLDEILLERRKELAYEGHRIFDLTRHRRGVVRVDCTGDVCAYAYPGPYFILPIPLDELAANPNMTQNPGYEAG